MIKRQIDKKKMIQLQVDTDLSNSRFSSQETSK